MFQTSFTNLGNVTDTDCVVWSDSSYGIKKKSNLFYLMFSFFTFLPPVCKKNYTQYVANAPENTAAGRTLFIYCLKQMVGELNTFLQTKAANWK